MLSWPSEEPWSLRLLAPHVPSFLCHQQGLSPTWSSKNLRSLILIPSLPREASFFPAVSRQEEVAESLRSPHPEEACLWVSPPPREERARSAPTYPRTPSFVRRIHHCAQFR